MTFEESIRNFKKRLVLRGYPKGLIEKTLSEVNFKGRKATLTQKTESTQENFALCHPISTVCAMFEKDTYEQMAFNRKPNVT